mmetsp:Transcript_16907/g.30182  ORF Transcript_16907/g.30182 Transcript_16907/m.30182 type:complete len:235 (-) Transcript_16907:147-851(-)
MGAGLSWNQWLRGGFSPGKVLGIAAVTAGGYCLWQVSSRIYKAVKYYSECTASTIVAPGLKCKGWVAGQPKWFRINDVIMGGKSTSELGCDGSGRLLFTGVINTNGGGFASFRTNEETKVAIAEDSAFVKVVAEGDGKMYKIALGCSHSMMTREPVFTSDFLTEKGKVKQYILPLSKFVPQFHGQKVEGVTLKKEGVVYVGCNLSLVTQNGDPNPYFGDGPFKLVIHELSFVQK